MSGPPGPPELSVHRPGEKSQILEELTVRSGEVVVLVCSPGGGNPEPRIVFTRDGKPVGKRGASGASGGGSANGAVEFRFRPSRRDNGATFGCLAQSGFGPAAASKQELLLSVQCEQLHGERGEIARKSA